MHCKYCNENSIIFDLVEAMEFDYIVVDLRRVKSCNSRSYFANFASKTKEKYVQSTIKSPEYPLE